MAEYRPHIMLTKPFPLRPQCVTRHRDPGPRTIVLGDPLAPKQKHPSNVTCNQKYTVFSFLPIVLYEQFKHFFNLYFLLVACSQVCLSVQCEACVRFLRASWLLRF